MTKGCYAELTTIDARLAMPVPDEVDWVPAAALPVWFMTAHDALVTAGRFTAGGSVLIQGASSGIGLATLAVAKLLRANRVLGTSTSRTKLDRLLALGLDEGILIGEEDVGQAVRAATDARGVDVVVDMIGGGQLAASVSACAIRGPHRDRRAAGQLHRYDRPRPDRPEAPSPRRRDVPDALARGKARRDRGDDA